MIGKRLSHFHILEKIDEGGMGVVYKAEDEKLGRPVALKVLHPEFIADEERRLRFIREARTAAAVTHPNIATIHQIDEDDGVIFIAMELVEGKKLSRRIDGRPLSSDEALALAVEIAEGLAAAHQSGIVHRDLKPDNVIIGADGHLKILDFGLAKIYDGGDGPIGGDASGMQTVSAEVTRDGRILGTVAYMSPEQARGLPVDARSDIFSFGVLLFEMVTGKTPFTGETITDTLSAILRDPQPPIAQFNPQVPAELERIMARCLEKDPAGRYANADELLGELRRLKRITDSHSQPVPLVSDSGIAFRGKRPVWLRPLPLAAAAAALLLAVLSIVALSGLIGGGASSVAGETDSLAVLPFENLQDAEDVERYGQILQELIITDLSGLSSMTVLSSQRLFDLQKQLGRGEKRTIDRDMATEVARRAGAATMLTGSVARNGEQWILTSQLVDLQNGTVLKSERIDGPDLYAMVDDLTHRLRDDLGVVASDAPVLDMAVKERTSSSLEAYQAFLEGQEKLNRLEWQEAVEAFQAAVDTDPDFGAAYYKLAIASWWAKGLDANYSGIEGGGPVTILEDLLDGDLKLTTKNRQLAEAFQSLVKYSYDEAEQRFARLVELYPDEKEAWYGLGEALFHGKGQRSPRSLEPFEKAIELDPGFHLAYYHAVDIYADEQMYDRGIDAVRALLEEYPDDANWRGQLLKLLVMKGDDGEVERLIEESAETIADAAGRQQILLSAAQAYSRRARLGEARRYVEQALAIDTDEDRGFVLVQLAEFRFFMQEFDAAERSYLEAVDIDPRNVHALEGLLKIYDAQRQYDKALGKLRELIEADPEFPPYYGLWLAAAMHRGDESEIRAARRSVDAVLRRETTSAEQRNWILMRGYRAQRHLGNYTAAEEYAVEIQKGEPESAKWWGLRGWAALELGRYEDAAPWFDLALEEDPKQADALEGRVRIALQRGNFDAAIVHSKRLVEAVPEKWGASQFLLETYLRAGRVNEAEILVESKLDELPAEAEKMEWLSLVARTHVMAGYPESGESLARRSRAMIAEVHHPGNTAILAWSLLRQDRRDEAARILRDDLEALPRNWLLNQLAAVVELLGEDLAGAERRLRDLLRSGPVRSELHGLLACTLSEQGKFKEAERYARAAAAMHPDRDSKSLLAWVLIAGDLDLKRGVEIAREAMNLPRDLRYEERVFPYNPSAEHGLGLAYLKQGDYIEAARVLQRAADLRPDRPSIRAHLDQAVAQRASLD